MIQQTPSFTYSFPIDSSEFYTKGNFTDSDGNEIYFEIPSVFGADGNVMENETLEILDQLIALYNRMSVTR